MDQSDKEGSDGSKIFKSQEEFETAVVANGLVLFFGGFDTSSTTASVLCWFLAKHPEVQETLYEEIRDAIEANDNSEYLDYDTVQTLPYLDGIISFIFISYFISFFKYFYFLLIFNTENLNTEICTCFFQGSSQRVSDFIPLDTWRELV